MPISSLTHKFTFDGAKKLLTAKSPLRNLNVLAQEQCVASFKQRWVRRDGRLYVVCRWCYMMSKENHLLLLLGHDFLKLFTLKSLKIFRVPKYYNEILYIQKTNHFSAESHLPFQCWEVRKVAIIFKEVRYVAPGNIKTTKPIVWSCKITTKAKREVLQIVDSLQ